MLININLIETRYNYFTHDKTRFYTMHKVHRDWIISGVVTIAMGGALIAMGVFTGFTIIPGIALIGFGVAQIGIGVGGAALSNSIENDNKKRKQADLIIEGCSNAQRATNQLPPPASTVTVNATKDTTKDSRKQSSSHENKIQIEDKPAATDALTFFAPCEEKSTSSKMDAFDKFCSYFKFN